MEIFPDQTSQFKTPFVTRRDKYSSLADELGIKFGIMNCPGWATAGGPWISPEQSMKMLVWNKTFIEGGKRWRGKIDTPPSKYGFYKDIALLAVKEKDHPILAEKNIDGTEILFLFNESVEAYL